MVKQKITRKNFSLQNEVANPTLTFCNSSLTHSKQHKLFPVEVADLQIPLSSQNLYSADFPNVSKVTKEISPYNGHCLTKTASYS